MNTSIVHRNMNTEDVVSTVPPSKSADTSGMMNTVTETNANIPRIVAFNSLN